VFAVTAARPAAAEPDPWVKHVRIDGNRAFSDRTLRNRLATRPTGWWPLAHRQPFDAAALDVDLRRVTAFYADRGYFDARITDHHVAEHDKGAVDVVIVVDEGKPTHVEHLALEHFPGGVDRSVRAAARRAGLREGAVFDYDRYAELKAAAGAALKEAGYAYSTVKGDVAVDRDRRMATVTLDASPGPFVRLGRAEITGNGGIPTAKLLHRVTWDPGDPYHPSEISTTQGRLYEFGVFSSVRMDLPPEPTDHADVHITVTPGRLHEVKLGGGAGIERSRQEVRLRAQWTASNFMGGLRKLRLRLLPAYVAIPDAWNPQRSGPTVDADADLMQPDLFSADVTLHALAGFETTLTEGYRAQGPRAVLGLERPFFRSRLLLGGSWNLQYYDFTDVSDVFDPTKTPLGLGFVDPYRLAFLEQTAQLDLRDRALAPRYGGFAAVRFEEGSSAFAGQFDYLKISPELRLYVPLHRRVVLAGRAQVGWLRPFSGGDMDSPVTRRYRLGGPSSHRGFGFGRLSPQVADDKGRLVPVGGNGSALGSLDLRVDVLKLGGQWLGVTPFFDTGDVVASFDRLSLGHMHNAAGISLDYDTPIGAVRAGVAMRLNRLSGEIVPDQPVANPDPGQRFVFHVTIGEAF
jgi:translocation and assembly module TamA